MIKEQVKARQDAEKRSAVAERKASQLEAQLAPKAQAANDFQRKFNEVKEAHSKKKAEAEALTAPEKRISSQIRKVN